MITNTESELIEMIYDLIAQNPIKGCYDLTHDDLTSMAGDVDYSANEIMLTTPDNRRQFVLSLRQVFAA